MGTGTRERIIDAAARVMQSLGLARTTTKEIARAAGYSEATLYKHFRDKEELFLEVLQGPLPPLVQLLRDLPDRAGEGTVSGHLEEVARAALDVYRQGMPMNASLFAAPVLLARHRERLTDRGDGLHDAPAMLAAYLAAERDLGRVAGYVDPSAAAALLLGACFQQAFLAAFAGEDLPGEQRDALAAALVRTLLRGQA